MSNWKRVKVKGAPDWLQERAGANGTLFRVDYRKLGFEIRKVIPGNFDSWRQAVRPGEQLLEQEKKISKENAVLGGKLPHEVLCSEVVHEILKDKLRNELRDATYNQAELFYRRHILPFLGGHVEKDLKKGAEKIWMDGRCPKAKNLNPQVWKDYKDAFRKANPSSPLFNHWKFFVTLFRYAKDLEIIDRFYKLEYSEEREDNREEGLIIPDEGIQKMIFRAATKNWRHRIIIQRWTGRRPGEVRNMRTKAITKKTRAGADVTWEPNVFLMDNGELMLRFYDYDTKNRKGCEFFVESELVKSALRDQMARYPESPFLFPNERDNSKPMDKCLNGWYSTLERAGLDPNFTPHDLRHTYLTQMFKASNEWAVICYQAGITLEEAEKTYLHLGANDTRALARMVAEKASQMGVG